MNKVIRNSMSIVVSIALIATTIMIPVYFTNGNTVNAETREVKADGTLAKSGATIASTIRYGKKINFSIRGDGESKYKNSSYKPTSGEVIYIAYTAQLIDSDGYKRGDQMELLGQKANAGYFVKTDKLGKWSLKMTFQKMRYIGSGSNKAGDWTTVERKTKRQYFTATGPHNTYKITLKANKGKLAKSKRTKTVTSYKNYGKLPTPKRTGYSFAGWFTKKSGGKFVNNKKAVTNLKKHNLYAHWVKKTEHASNDQYKAVKKGMKYSEVKRIFNKEGTYTGKTDGKQVYAWYRNEHQGKAYAISFRNEVVVQKVKITK